MTLAQSRATFSERMSEVRSVHALISSIETGIGLGQPTVELLSLRGLFFVHLYGAFEKAVNAGIEEFLRQVKATEVRYLHLSEGAFLYSLDTQFDSISAMQGKKGFEKRAAFIKQQFSPDPVDMPDTIFNMSLQNVGAGIYEDVFSWLNLGVHPFQGDLVSRRGYLDEIVEKRRKVAHGREAASVVGQGTRAPELLVRVEAITQCVEHLYGALEACVTTKSFVSAVHRASYL